MTYSLQNRSWMPSPVFRMWFFYENFTKLNKCLKFCAYKDATRWRRYIFSKSTVQGSEKFASLTFDFTKF